MEDINKNILETFKTFNTHFADYIGALYVGIFHTVPKLYHVYYNNKNKLTYNNVLKKLDVRKDVGNRYNNLYFINKAFADAEKTETLQIIPITSNEFYIINKDENNYFLISCLTVDNEESADYFEYVYTNNIKETFKIIKKWFKPYYNKEDVEFGIAAMNAANTLYTTWYDYPYKEIDINLNYNDDLPYDKICNLIEKEKSSELLLFYGEPGTGKSSLIKHLICKYPDTSFIFIDGTLLACTSQEKLMSYFLDNENTIFILEDCEKSLMNRDNNYNPVMPVLLNMTDGILGDVLGIKLICTFNTALSNIDKALLRKGRLSLKYEFKKLNKEKVKKILNDNTINSDMILADIYNIEEENDYSKKQTSKIGF